MPRIHLFELEDQPWFPAVLRDAATAYLEFIAAKSGHAARIAPTIAKALDRAGAKRIVDLGSGGAGPVSGIVAVLASQGRDVRALLTDLYPNLAALARASARSDGRITYRADPVDATRVPADADGLRTMFNAFHHLRPDAARKVLGDAVAARQPIAIVEMLSRHPLQLLGMPLVPLLVALAVPFLRPLRLAWLPLTYLVPVLPLFAAWDGLVSCLRVYSPAELEELTRSLEGGSTYDWEIGRVAMGLPGAQATYLIGTPAVGS
jgi:hypothetical protein